MSVRPGRNDTQRPPEIRHSVDLGAFFFFDTAEVCGPFSNEEVAGEALTPTYLDASNFVRF